MNCEDYRTRDLRELLCRDAADDKEHEATVDEVDQEVREVVGERVQLRRVVVQGIRNHQEAADAHGTAEDIIKRMDARHRGTITYQWNVVEHKATVQGVRIGEQDQRG